MRERWSSLATKNVTNDFGYLTSPIIVIKIIVAAAEAYFLVFSF